jgi:N-glycosidase YbiA
MMIEKFQGKHRFLSNFWPSRVDMGIITYPTVEHAYQAAKTLDYNHRKRIALLDTPGQAKREGKLVVVRADWDEVKIMAMTFLVTQKFRIPELRKMLVDTGDEYIQEGNTWGDVFWGVCRGKGHNHLGHIIMDIRSKIIESGHGRY